MNAVELEHPSDALLKAFGLGQLSEEELASVDEHLANCADCRENVEAVAPDTFLMVVHSAATKPDSTEWWMAESGGAPAGPVGSGSPAPPAGAPSALTNHPRYRVGELLGIGGMGAVYKAEHLLMERPVALKVLSRKWTDKPATVERFRREVRAAARLTHPNIVAAFDAEQAGDIHFLAMEYVEGISLARRCAERGPLPVPEACEYIRQAALGLQHAHECGMVHRDIKPQNLMLTPSGQIKILDFGLSRFVVESAPVDTSLSLEPDPTALPGQELSALRLTHTGLVMGTPDYIAPEQARDSHLADIRSDIYSLGCTLYELLAGLAPIPDGNALHKVRGHLSRTPQPLDTLRREAPSELVRIVDRMMAKDPAHRYQTPADVAKAMTPFVAVKPPRRKLKVALAACIAFLTIALAGIIYVQTDHGKIIIETNDETIAVMIQNAGGVKIVDQTTKREYFLKLGERNLPLGDYLVEVTDPLAGWDFQTKKFELKRGQEVRLTAKFVADGDGNQVLAGLTKLNAKSEGLYNGKPARYWLEQLLDVNLKFRADALESLGGLAQNNKELIPVLVSFLKDPNLKDSNGYLRATAARQLGSLGPDVVPAMIEVLKDTSSVISLCHAADAIGQIGPSAKATVPYLVQTLQVDDLDVRFAAIRALGQIGPEAKTAIPAMIAVTEGYLKNGNVELLEKSQGAYGTFFQKLGSALTDIDPDPEMKAIFQRYAYAIDSSGSRYSIEGPISKDQAMTKIALAIDALKKRYPFPGPIEPLPVEPNTKNAGGTAPKQSAKDEDIYQGKPASFWLNQLRDSDVKFRAEAVRAVGSIARSNKTYIPVLVNALNGSDEVVGYAASNALARLGKEAVPTLLEIFDRPKSPDAMRNALVAVGLMAPPASDAVPFAIHALQSGDDKMCGAAIFALGHIGTEARSAMPAIVQVLGDHLNSMAFFEERAVAMRTVTTASPPTTGRGPTFTGGGGVASTIGVNLIWAVTRLDSDTKSIIQELTERGRGDFGDPFGVLGLSDAEKHKQWQKLYDTLKKKYPNPPTIIPSTPHSKVGTDLPPMPMQVAKDDGPLYLGKPASHWLALLDDAAPEYRLDALEALGNLAEKKKDLVPVLVSVLKDNRFAMRDVKVGGFGGKLKQGQGDNNVGGFGGKGSKGSKQGQGDNNAGSFAGKGKKKADNNVSAPGAGGTVIKQRVYLGNRASAILFSLGPDVLPVLVEHVDQTSPDALRRAMSLIVSFGPKAKASAAVPLLIKVLQNKDWELRHPATEALATIGPSAKPAIPLIVDFLGATLEKKHEIEELEARSNQTARRRAIAAAAGAGEKGNGKGKDAGPDFEIGRLELLAPIIVDALLHIEPEIKAVLPTGMLDVGNVRSESGINLEAPVTLWKQTYEALKKRYPKPLTSVPSAPAAKVGTELAPMPKQVADAGPWYQGKSTNYWLKQLEDAAPAHRREAVEALGRIAEKNRSVIPTLVAALEDRDDYVASVAAAQLRTLGADVIPDLVKHVDQKSPEAMRHAAEAIGPIGAKGKAAVPMLTNALRMDNWPLRRAAVDALARIGHDAKPSIPAIVDVLGHSLEDKDIVEHLQRAAAKPNEAVLGDSHDPITKQIRRPLPIAILGNLLIIEPEIKSILPEGILDSGQVRTHSGINLTASVAVWKQTHEALKKRYPDLQPIQSAAKAISPVMPVDDVSKLGAKADEPHYKGKPATYWLEQFKDRDPNTRIEALLALRAIWPKDEKMIPILVMALTDANEKVGSTAITAFGSYGAWAVPALLEVLKDQSSVLGMSRAASALGRIGEPAKAAVPLLTQSLKTENWNVRRTSTFALGRIGPSAKPALPELVEIFGLYLESQEYRHFADAKRRISPGIDFRENAPLSAIIVASILEIDPEAKGALPTGILGSGAFRVSPGGGQDVNANASPELWRQTHEALRKKYAPAQK